MLDNPSQPASGQRQGAYLGTFKTTEVQIESGLCSLGWSHHQPITLWCLLPAWHDSLTLSINCNCPSLSHSRTSTLGALRWGKPTPAPGPKFCWPCSKMVSYEPPSLVDMEVTWGRVSHQLLGHTASTALFHWYVCPRESLDWSLSLHCLCGLQFPLQILSGSQGSTPLLLWFPSCYFPVSGMWILERLICCCLLHHYLSVNLIS